MTEDLSSIAIADLLSDDPNRDYLAISHSVDRRLHYKVSRLIETQGKHKACTVFLTTYGGDPNGGYRVARCLRHHYTHVRVVVPSFCKSAGTLIAIAANELAIGDLGELGPLDIQVRKGSELQESSSGLDIMQALQAVTLHTQETFHRIMIGTRGFGLSTKLCADFAAQVASGIASPLISQIDPIRVGEMQRATSVAFEYGQRLDEYSKNLRDGALERLISEYPAHGFVIDRKEAGELFKSVRGLSKAEGAFCSAFWPFFEQEHKNIYPFFAKIPSGQAEEANDESASATPIRGQAANEANDEAAPVGMQPEPERRGNEGSQDTRRDSAAPV